MDLEIKAQTTATQAWELLIFAKYSHRFSLYVVYYIVLQVTNSNKDIFALFLDDLCFA